MLLAKSLRNTNIIDFWWDIKTSEIEYYDIQYSAERTISYGWSQTKTYILISEERSYPEFLNSHFSNTYFSWNIYDKTNFLAFTLRKLRATACHIFLCWDI